MSDKTHDKDEATKQPHAETEKPKQKPAEKPAPAPKLDPMNAPAE